MPLGLFMLRSLRSAADSVTIQTESLFEDNVVPSVHLSSIYSNCFKLNRLNISLIELQEKSKKERNKTSKLGKVQRPFVCVYFLGAQPFIRCVPYASE